MVDFEEIIGRIKSLKGLSTDAQLAEMFGLSPQDFNKRKKRGTLLPLIIEFGINQNVYIDWLLTGRGQECAPSDILQKTGTDDVVVQKHMSLAMNFSDKNGAVSINEKLLKLEKLNPEAFKKIDVYISGLIDGIKMSQADSASGGAPAEKARKKRTNGQ